MGMMIGGGCRAARRVWRLAPVSHAPLISASNATGVFAAGLDRRWISTRPKTTVPVDSKKLSEAFIVRDCGNRWMKWLGRGSVAQMYCALLLSGTLIFQADVGANMFEVVATSGAISSASASVYFAAKLMCDKVVTDVVSYRRLGERDEFVRVTVLGAMSKQDLHGRPSDLKLLAHDGEDAYKFQLGERRLLLDTSTGECVNRKALELLLQGKPLVVRKTKQGKKRSRE